MQWVDPETDYDCLIVRSHLGALCGYVGLPFVHTLHGADYSDVDVSVHGGLTFASLCDEEHPEGICHVPAPGRPDNVWWLGFDCGHFRDVMPLMDKQLADMRDNPIYKGMPPLPKPDYAGAEWLKPTYKTLPYVITEVTSLAAQLKELA